MQGAPAPVLHLRSLGQLTADVQRPYAALARAVEALGVVPALTIDGVPYFDAGAVERITAAVANAATMIVATPPPTPRPSNRGASGAATPPFPRTALPTPHAPARRQRRSRQGKPHDQLSDHPNPEGTQR